MNQDRRPGDNATSQIRRIALTANSWSVRSSTPKKAWKQAIRPIRNREASGAGAATSLSAMDITIQASFLPHNDPDASLAFYRDTLGFEIRNDVGYGGLRWITVGPPGQPGTSIVLYPPGADPGITDDERRTITEMMAKGTYGILTLATADLDDTFANILQSGGGEVVQEPTQQPYGVRDCAFRDPSGNLIRINEVR